MKADLSYHKWGNEIEGLEDVRLLAFRIQTLLCPTPGLHNSGQISQRLGVRVTFFLKLNEPQQN
jgi:hypothetical protein